MAKSTRTSPPIRAKCSTSGHLSKTQGQPRYVHRGGSDAGFRSGSNRLHDRSHAGRSRPLPHPRSRTARMREYILRTLRSAHRQESRPLTRRAAPFLTASIRCGWDSAMRGRASLYAISHRAATTSTNAQRRQDLMEPPAFMRTGHNTRQTKPWPTSMAFVHTCGISSSQMAFRFAKGVCGAVQFISEGKQ